MGILTESDEFQRLVTRERARFDRTGRGFSVIAITLNEGPASMALVQKIAKRIKAHLRACDDIGWMGADEMYVLVPETRASGADSLASRLQQELSGLGVTAEYRVFCYPNDWMDENGTSAKETADSRPEHPKRDGGNGSGWIGARKLFPSKLPAWKRALDMVLSLWALVLFAPIMLAIAAFIKTVSRGPVIFSQHRVGFRGRCFPCYKFRTMKTGADAGLHRDHIRNLASSDMPMQKLDQIDPRVIPGGRFLRASGLDELPQLFNILKGEMSFIGPRPCIPYEAEHYRQWQQRRFDTAPGLSGLWQVNGKNHTTFNEMMRMDIAYAKRRSLGLDLTILLKTPAAILEQLTFRD